MRHSRRSHLAILTILLGLIAGAAHAQFAGDMFFADPSVAVPEGGTATMEVQLFSGATAVGATQFDLVYDPTQVEVVAVEPGTTKEFENGVSSAPAAPGRTGIVTLNGASLDHPFGTESLARVTLRPLAGAGSRVQLGIQVRSLLRTSSTPFPAGRGFSGELVVVSANQPAQAPAKAKATVDRTAPAQGAAADADHTSRALALRRPGNRVELVDVEERGGRMMPVRSTVVVPDPGAPSESGDH